MYFMTESFNEKIKNRGKRNNFIQFVKLPFFIKLFCDFLSWMQFEILVHDIIKPNEILPTAFND